jgi:hypothetical protein
VQDASIADRSFARYMALNFARYLALFCVAEYARLSHRRQVSDNFSHQILPSQTWRYVQLWQELTWFRFSLGSDKHHLSEAKKNAG